MNHGISLPKCWDNITRAKPTAYSPLAGRKGLPLKDTFSVHLGWHRANRDKMPQYRHRGKLTDDQSHGRITAKPDRTITPPSGSGADNAALRLQLGFTRVEASPVKLCRNMADCEVLQSPGLYLREGFARGQDLYQFLGRDSKSEERSDQEIQRNGWIASFHFCNTGLAGSHGPG